MLAISRDHPLASDQSPRPFGEMVRERGLLPALRCFGPLSQPLSTRRTPNKWGRVAVPLYATNQPRGRGVGAVTAGYGTPWVSGFRDS